MSANLELVRSIYADWERGDFSSTEWADAEIEWAFADESSTGVWTGLGIAGTPRNCSQCAPLRQVSSCTDDAPVPDRQY